VSAPLTVAAVRRRFLVLAALRWLPTGVLVPVLVLLPLDRGVGLAELGVAFATQGVVVMLLELPTGGLADAAGRRRTLLAASVFGLASIVWFLVADSLTDLVAVFALQGVYRALDSGPLEAWYVDTTHALEPDAEIDGGLSAYGVVVGLAVALGALVAGGLVALDPLPGVDALAVPVLLSLALQVAGVVGLVVMMTESRRGKGAATALQAALQTPRTIADGFRLVRGSRVLAALVAVELFWGFGMVTFESLPPVRLEEILGDADKAAALTGPAGSAAWAASALGAALVTLLTRRIGTAPAAALLRVAQGLTVVGMGLAGGVVGVITAYLLCYAVHGASNPAHMTLLHREATSSVRATVVSLNSMVSQPAGALGAVLLTALASGTDVSTAMYVGGAVLALAAPLYLPAWRKERARPGPVVV
jgi:MFS family permease